MRVLFLMAQVLNSDSSITPVLVLLDGLEIQEELSGTVLVRVLYGRLELPIKC